MYGVYVLYVMLNLCVVGFGGIITVNIHWILGAGMQSYRVIWSIPGLVGLIQHLIDDILERKSKYTMHFVVF